MDEIINHFVCGHTLKESCKLVGYSESYSNTTLVSRLKRDPKFKSKLIQALELKDLIAVTKIQDAEMMAFDAIESELRNGNPDKGINNLSKLAGIAKQKKQIAGLLKQDQPQVSVTFNLDGMRSMMSQIDRDNDAINVSD